MKPFELPMPELKFADKPITCDSCGRTISVGRPYIIYVHVETTGVCASAFTKIECLTLCSVLMLRQAGPAGDEKQNYPNYPNYTFAPAALPVWNEYSQQATEREQKDFPIVLAKDANFRVATGYQEMITIGDTDFLAVKEDQWIKSNFARLIGEDGPVGEWEMWRSVNKGRFLKVRYYRQSTGFCQAGYVYLRMAEVMPQSKESRCNGT
jgi:hypothetical protein